MPKRFFDQLRGPYEVLPLRAKVNLGVMVMKEFPEFPKAPALLKPHRQIVSFGAIVGGRSHPSAEMYLVYSTDLHPSGLYICVSVWGGSMHVTILPKATGKL